MRLEPVPAPLDTVSCSTDSSSHGIVKRAIKEEDRAGGGNFRIPLLRVHRYGFVVEKLWHGRGCTGLPVLSCERSRPEELTSLSLFLSLFLFFFFSFLHRLTSPIIYPSPRSLSLSLSSVFSLPPSTPPMDPELPQQFRATQGHVR